MALETRKKWQISPGEIFIEFRLDGSRETPMRPADLSMVGCPVFAAIYFTPADDLEIYNALPSGEVGCCHHFSEIPLAEPGR